MFSPPRSGQSRHQQRTGGTQCSLETAENGRPLDGGQQALTFGPIALRLSAEFHRPCLGYQSSILIILGRSRKRRIDAFEHEINCIAIELLPNCFERHRGGVRCADCGEVDFELARKKNRREFKKQSVAEFGLIDAGGGASSVSEATSQPFS